MSKTRQYSRKLNRQQIAKLQRRYPKLWRLFKYNGFLTKDVRERLIHSRNWEQEYDRDAVAKKFAEIREHAQAAFIDYLLLFDTLEEPDLKRIFTYKAVPEALKEGSTIEDVGEYSREIRRKYPLTEIILALTPSDYRNKTLQSIGQEWRLDAISELVIAGLEWFLYSGSIKTDSHKNLIADTIDMISVITYGRTRIGRKSRERFRRRIS